MKKLILSTLVAVGLIGSVGAQTQLTGSLTNGLVAYYPLNGDTKDYSGNSNDLVFTKTNPIFLNGSISINKNSYLYSKNRIGISDNNSRTVSLWIYSLDTPTGLGVVDGGVLYSWGVGNIWAGDYTLGYAQWDSNLGPHIDLVLSGFWVGVGASNLNNKWHNITQVYMGDINTTQFYIDGVLSTNGYQNYSASGSINTIDTQLFINARTSLSSNNGGASGINGYYKNIVIYNRSLSPNEVALLYLKGNSPLGTNGFNYSTNNNSATIISYTGPNSSVTIPSTIGGLPVTAIGDNAFANQSNITTITIPNSVTNIGTGVFSGCPILSSVTIPDSVVSFGTGIFSGSSNVAIIGSQSLISYLSQNADSLGISGNALTSIQYGGTASGTYGWIKTWLLSDNTFLSSIASLIQFPSPAAQNLSNSIAALSAQTSPTNPVFISAVAAQILQGSNNFGIAVKQNQSLNFPTIPAITNTPAKKYTNTIASSSGLPVVQTVGNTAIATISNSVLTIIGEGTTTVTASQSGNALWNPVTASQPLIVVKGSQSIAFPPITVQKLTKTAVLKLTATSSANLPISYTVQNSGIAMNRTSNSLTLIGTGTTTITATNAGNQYFYPSSATQTLIVK